MTFRRRSSKDRGEPRGLMETPPFRMPPLYCITYADVNKCYFEGSPLKGGPFKREWTGARSRRTFLFELLTEDCGHCNLTP